jgi:signal transduction histidine kinase
VRLQLASALGSDSRESLEITGREALELIATEIERLRLMIAELRPAALDELGLEAALRTLTRRTTVRQELHVDTRISLEQNGAGGRTLPLETTIYRVVQEALTNVGRHANARRVILSVKERGGRIDVAVKDDGVGFDPSKVPDGAGIASMRERTELAGGTLEIRSAPGRGTELRAVLPVAPRIAAVSR